MLVANVKARASEKATKKYILQLLSSFATFSSVQLECPITHTQYQFKHATYSSVDQESCPLDYSRTEFYLRSIINFKPVNKSCSIKY